MTTFVAFSTYISSLPLVRRLLRLVVSTGAGLVGTMAYYSHIVRHEALTEKDGLLLLLYLFLLFSFVAYVALFRYAAPRIKEFSQSNQAVLGLVTLFGSIGIVIGLPVQQPISSKLHRLTITATGEKNAEAKASEVWVLSFIQEDSRPISPNTFVQEGNWEIRDNVPLSHKEQPSVLRWEGTLKGDATLWFVSHSWSGIVAIDWNGSTQRVDLYSPEQKVVRISLDAATGTSIGTEWRLPLHILYIVDILSFAVVLLVVTVVIIERAQRLPASVRAFRLLWLMYSLPCIAIWLIWRLAFFPAIMHSDSLDQWRQIMYFSFVDTQPVMHTLIEWFITRFWFSPGAITLIQIIILSGIVGWACARFATLGIPQSVIWIASLLFAISPVNATMLLNPWRDVAFSISLLTISLMMLEIIITKGQWITSTRNQILFAFIISLAALFRHNGLLVAVGTIVILGICLRQFWRNTLITGVVFVGIYLAVTGPLYSALRVERVPTWFWQGAPVHHVAAVIADGTPLTADEQSFLNSVLPMDMWIKNYNCANADSLVWVPEFNRTQLIENVETFQHIWRQLILRNPSAVIRNQLCVTELVWNIAATSELLTVKTGVPDNALNLKNQSQLPQLRELLLQVLYWTWQPNVIQFVWRPALYLYLAVGAIIVCVLRQRQLIWVLIITPALMNSLSYMLINVAQDFRYQYSVYLTGLLCISLFFIPRQLITSKGDLVHDNSDLSNDK